MTSSEREDTGAPGATIKLNLLRGAFYVLLLLTGTSLAYLRPEAPTNASPRALTFAERVSYQSAIEDVYWRHRIWPKANAGPKPSLDKVMSQREIEQKVQDYLRNSQALEDYWQRPITTQQLQAEMDRMAQHTKQSEMLRELFEALGNDPFVIAECLARSALSERLLTNLYAHDQRFHGELKQRAEADLQTHRTVQQMRQLSGNYSEIEVVRSDSAGEQENDGAEHGLRLNSHDWDKEVQKLAAMFSDTTTGRARPPGSPPTQINTGVLSPLQEDEERYYATAILNKSHGRFKLATVEWRKEALSAWRAKAEDQLPKAMAAVTTNYMLPTISADATVCSDTWTATSGPPSPRYYHTAVWTGSEMIIWGGTVMSNTYFNTGGRYNPSTDNWVATSITNAPSGRSGHTAVWTGIQMVVWGGNLLNTGGKYNPATDTWAATSITNAPGGREGHTAVWSGSEMIIWGGYNSLNDLNTGGRYNPGTNSWTATNVTNAPSARISHTAIWSGNVMVIWGGYDGNNYLNTGGRYNPGTNSWTSTGTINVPTGRELHTAVWTGSEMIIWGGNTGYGSDLHTGGRYNPGTNSWIPTRVANAPTARDSHSAVWTGSEMIVWGGATSGPDLNTGGRYNPGTDSWTATAITNAPDVRYTHTAVWTGSEMIVWGGFGHGYLNTGGRYNPATDSWTPTGGTDARSSHTAVWTGSEMIIWGGIGYSNVLNTGGRYNPSTDSWAATSTANAPDGRYNHTAVWTGSEMIAWGGKVYSGGNLDTGGRYNPATDSWAVTSTSNAPSARDSHTAVWTGNEMIIWGGNAGSNIFNTGGRYSPAADSWIATTATNAPSGRTAHTAIWTSTEMIVWGGDGNTGGRYNPSTNTWTATSTTNAPAGRYDHTAVWTGSEMIVWGGYDGSNSLNTGGRYNPSSNSWTRTSTTSAPDGRETHTSVWTGSEMIVWGGFNGTHLNTGGRYNPSTNNWVATTITNAPSGRSGHTAVWTDSEMIVWGGEYGGHPLDTGGRYCAAATTPTPTPTPTHTPTPPATATPTPVVTTSPTTNVASFSATLNGSLNPRGSTTIVYFQYGLTTSYGHTTAMQTQAGNGPRPISASISGLGASTIYHFRIVAHNGGGAVVGSDRTFTTLTPTGPPIVMTNPATNIGSFSATLDGSLDSHGLSTTVYFQYGTTTSYGSTTANQTKSGNTYQNVTASISGLAASSTYHFRIVATNSAGTRYGSDKSFTTFRKDESVAWQHNIVHDGYDPASSLVTPLTLKWRRNLAASGVTSISYPLIAEGRVFVTTSTGYTTHVQKLMALDALTGATIWSANVSSQYPFANAAYDSGKVFVVNSHGNVKAFDAATGAMLWSIVLPGQDFFTSPPTAANGIVYTGAPVVSSQFDGLLYALNETNGALLWTAMIAYGGDHSSPAIAGGKVFVSYADADSYAFNATTGQQVWSYLTCGSGGGGATPVVHAGQLYVRDYGCTPGIDGLVLDANTGGFIRTFNSDTPPAFFGNLALFLQSGTLVAIENGQMLWSFAGDGGLQSAPVVVNHTIYIGSSSGVLYGLNASGHQIWSTQVGAPIPYPDEHNPVITTGLGAGGGLLIVPTASTLVAYGN